VGHLSRHLDVTLFEVFRRFADRDPGLQWLTFERADGAARLWTYQEFVDEVERTIGRLAEAGLRPGQTFVVSLDNHPDLIRLVLAASASGCIAVPADTRLTARELDDYFNVSGARVLFTRPEHGAAIAAAAEHDAEVVPVGDPLDDPPSASGGSRPPASSTGDVFELIFTSGTTSRPKGVMMTSRAVAYGASTLAAAAGYTASDVPLVALPLYHAAAQMHQLWPTLVVGGQAVVVEGFAPTVFFAQTVRHGATTSAQFAATLRLLLRRGNETDARRSLPRHVTFAQSLTTAEFGEWDRRFGIPLQQLWGMTETVGLPLMSPLFGDRRLTSVGQPVEGYDVVVRGPDGEPVPPGEPGEITVRAEPGATVALGYYRNPRRRPSSSARAGCRPATWRRSTRMGSCTSSAAEATSSAAPARTSRRSKWRRSCDRSRASSTWPSSRWTTHWATKPLRHSSSAKGTGRAPTRSVLTAARRWPPSSAHR
jgi:carnitine-CoA ligase